MNDELNTILSQLDSHVQNMSVERIIDELTIVSERLQFANLDYRDGTYGQEQREQLEFLLGHDVSQGMLQFVLFLALQHALHYLMDDMSETFITYCRTYFNSRKQINFVTAITLTDDTRERVLQMLRRDQPEDCRILLTTDRSIMAGFVLNIDEAQPVDYSYKTQVVKLIEQYVSKQQQEYHATNQ